MEIKNLDNFLESYFKAHECEIIDRSDGVLSVQLTEQMDRTLMNRPFYWHYIKSIGQKGEPMQLTLITNPNKKDEPGEWIHFGSPRLQQIMNDLKEKQHNVKLFEVVNVMDRTAMYPWLVVNIKVSYEGQHNKDELFSIGLQLVTGRMETNVMESLLSIQLDKSISDFCYPISPLIRLPSAFKRIESVIDTYVESKQHEWATRSLQTLEEEIKLVEHFYDDENEMTQLEKEIDDLTNRYTPVIKYKIINGGVIYLRK